MTALAKENKTDISQDSIRNAAGAMYHGKDKFENVFSIVSNIMYDRNNYPSNTRML